MILNPMQRLYPVSHIPYLLSLIFYTPFCLLVLSILIPPISLFAGIDNPLIQQQGPAASVSVSSTNPFDNMADYRQFPLLGSRVVVWFVGQLHLMFGAFILGVPIFAVIVEFIGIRTRNPRYDRMARDFIKLTIAAFSTTAILGALLVFIFIGFYPRFFSYLSSIFYPTFLVYSLIFFGETFTLYLYGYTWDRLKDHKVRHLILGILLNVFGITIMVIANSWVSFMISPAGIDEQGRLLSLWDAIKNFTWTPLNIHRFVANISFGGAVVAAYAGFRYLIARTEAERAHYDWEGYTGNFIAISAFMVLPFAGYWLTKEIYSFNEQLGVTLMGGFLSWLWIIQAVLIGALFMATNYYLWVGMERIPGAERYRGYIKYLIFVLALCFLVWATPHTLVASLEETKRMGGTHHPVIGPLGLMSAKNTAVNMMILATFMSFLLYRRSNKISCVSWTRVGGYIQICLFFIASAVVIFYGVYGYFVEAIIRIGFSVYQVSAVIFAIVSISVIDIFLYHKARKIGAIRWGQIPSRSQYILLLIAVTYTWLMGLMGFARSAMRQHWHVYGVIKDTSVDAYTPALGYAANMVSIITVVFIGLVLFIFWLGTLGDRREKVLKGETVEKFDHQPRPLRIILKGMLFSLGLIGLFAFYANSIPQLESKVPEEIIISKEGLTQAGLIDMGRQIFFGKGNCYVCHKEIGSRGPDLNNIGAYASNRKPGVSSLDYLMESLIKPRAYLVKGYEDIMPRADKPPMSLNQAELLTVIAYLQSLGGIVTVKPRDVQAAISHLVSAQEVQQRPPLLELPWIKGDIDSGLEVFLDNGCNVCHLIEGDEEKYGPNLSHIGTQSDITYIIESILDPEAKIIKGYKFKMPKDYEERLSVKEFNDLVAFLASLKG